MLHWFSPARQLSRSLAVFWNFFTLDKMQSKSHEKEFMIKRFLLLAALSLSGLASGHTVMDALKVIDRSKQEDWHYRVTESIAMKDKNISTTIGIFDPSKEKTALVVRKHSWSNTDRERTA